MGLIKAEKKEVVFITLINNNGVYSVDKSFSELCEMFDSGFLPVLIDNINYEKIYLYPEVYIPNNGIIFSNVSTMITGYESLKTVAILSSSIIYLEEGLNTTGSFKAVISKNESGYECDRSYSEFNQFCIHKGYTPLVQLKKDDTFNSFIPLVFGGREYDDNGKDSFFFYYNNYYKMKRFLFKIRNDGITMTESTIS